MRAMQRLALALTFVLVSTSVHADSADPAEACADASEKGQLLKIKGKLAEARTQFLSCIADACPPVVRKDCGQFLVEVEAATPTVVFAARDASGDLTDVRVTASGALVAEKLEGKAITMDPGAYELRFESKGHLPITQKVVVREGEKNRLVSVTLEVDRPVVVVDSKPVPPPTAAWIAAGVGVVGLGAFTVLGLSARAEFSDLKDSCDSRCAEDDVDRVKRRALFADIGLVVGLAGAGVATWLFVDHARHTEVRAVARSNWVGLEGSF